MKAKLLKMLRAQGRCQISIHSVTTTTSWRGEFITGMSYGYSNDAYRDLFALGDTKEEVRDKAMRIYMRQNIEHFREKYKRYSRKYKMKAEQ